MSSYIFNKIINNLDWVLLTLIINMTVVRFFLRIYESNFITLLFSIAIFIIYISKYFLDTTKKITINKSGIVVFGLVIYSMLSFPINGFYSVSMFIKLLIGILLAIVAFSFNITKLNRCIDFTIIINLIYALFILVFHNYSFSYFSNTDTNYLTVTITIALTLSLLFGRFVNILRVKLNIIKIILYFIEIIICLFVILLFPGRGNIIFPFCVISSIFTLISLFDYKYFFKYLPIILMLVCFCAYIYFSYANDHTINRLFRLFESTSSESRVDIYKNYIDSIIDNKWYLWGSGTNSAIAVLGYYPHNIYLQIIGEYGIVGIIFASVFTFIVFFSILKVSYYTFARRKYNNTFELLFCSVVSGLIYYWLTFNKSFSFYDSYPLMIFVAFLLKLDVSKANYQKIFVVKDVYLILVT